MCSSVVKVVEVKMDMDIGGAKLLAKINAGDENIGTIDLSRKKMDFLPPPTSS